MATPTPRAVVSAVRAFARRHDLFRPGPLIVAVSGGADSVALALILAELREEFGLVLHVAHFDHRARPRSAARDAAFVAQVADRIGAPIRVGRAERAPKNEDEARRDRYAFLRRAAKDVGATAIATGHTQDDQAETVLLHLVRGSGLAGLAAMRPLRDGVVRPLLATARAETRAVCAAAKIRPREDPSNRALRFARNRVRLRVLPELEHINPRVRAALARFADAAAEVEARITADSDPPGAAARDVRPRAAGELDIGTLPRDRDARGRALMEAWRAATGGLLGTRHRAALLDLVSSTDGSRRLDLPGGQALREYATLRLLPTRAAAAIAPSTDGIDPRPPQALVRGLALTWPGWRVRLDLRPEGLPFFGAVDAVTASRLIVRTRRAGDTFDHGKLQDLFVNAKVPSRLRDTWPVIALNGDEVLWVPGLTPAPHTGRIAISAGRVGDTGMPGGTRTGASGRESQVASKSAARPRGGKRGRP